MGTLAKKGRYKSQVDRMSAILDALWLHDMEYYDSSGNVTTILSRALPEDQQVTKQAMLNTLDYLEADGWISRDKRTKRTYSIKMIAIPEDWVQPSKVLSTPVDSLPDPMPIKALPLSEAPVDAIEVPADTLDGRPGRLAARIERTIPALVQEGVQQGIEGAINGFLARLGVGLGNDDQLLSQLAARDADLDNLRTTVHQIQDELRVERQMHEASRQELNKMTARTEGNVVGSKVRAHDMPEMYRGLATHAIANGWMIDMSAGNHYRWKSPLGGVYFSPSTPSDWRSVRNARADMEKMGLPKASS